jgi:hypothetical protein
MEWYNNKYDLSYRWAEAVSSNTNFLHQNKIFILGSSQVAALNATYIEEQISKNDSNYIVYNLSKDGDVPTNRLNSLEKIISLKPDVIVYGIGFRDLEKTSLLNTDSIITPKISKPESILPDPHQFLEQLLPLENLGKYFGGYSPHVITTELIKNFRHHSKIQTFNNSSTPFQSYTANFFITENETELKNDFNKNSLPFNGLSENDNEVIALNEIVKKFLQNNIKVIVFTTPYHKIYLDSLSESDKKTFNSIFDEISKNYGLKTYYLHDKYSSLNIWRDYKHTAMTKEGLVYSADVAKIIQKEIQ